MAKSLGNFYSLDDLKRRGFTPAEVRYALISGHYRGPLNFTLHSLDAARAALQKIAKMEKPLREKAGLAAAPSHDALVRNGSAGSFGAAWMALLNDLNVPEALGCIFSVINRTKVAELSAEEARSIWLGLHFMLDAIGIVLPELKEEEAATAPDEITQLAQQRWSAKQAKEFSKADELRKQIEAAGWIIKDSKDGFTVVPKS
jgi:cysteinyl-tRNA synthetase